MMDSRLRGNDRICGNDWISTEYLLISVFLLMGIFFPTYVHSSSLADEKKLYTDVTFLSSDSLEGRLTGTNGEKRAMQYIAAKFQDLGLEPAGDNGTFFQEFEFKNPQRNQAGMQPKKLHGQNVVAKLKVNQNAVSLLVVGAHADHLGRGEVMGSLEKEKMLIHNGADDNASGVASVLEAARKLTEFKKRGKLQGNKDILFVIWSGEELGSLGSNYFIKNFLQKNKINSLREVVDAYINLDMVGRLKKNLIIQGVGSSSQWNKLFEQSNSKTRLSLVAQNDPYLPTDSTPFYLQGVPAINFFTGAHADYHTSRDKIDKLNFSGMSQITNFLTNLVLAIENDPKFMDFHAVEKTGGHTGRGFRVYLGTIPDYTSADLQGVKLAGVAKNSPAEHAGLRQNDVIVEFAGKKIRDIYDYSSALHALHAKDPASLVVLRGPTKLTLTIVAQLRE